MKVTTLIRLAATLAVLTSPLAAQIHPPEPWRLDGTAGFSYRDTSQTSKVNGTAPSGNSSDYLNLGGEFWLGLKGFLLDPRFLPFNVDFGGLYAGNNLNVGDYLSSNLNWGVNTTFLPSRPYPLRFYYRRTSYNADGSVFNQDTSTSMLGVEWSLRLPQLPKTTVACQQYSNDILLPSSASDSRNRQRQFQITAEDSWKGWDWNAGFTMFRSKVTLVDPTAAPGDSQEDFKGATLRVYRPFWGDRAEFRLDNWIQWRDTLYGGIIGNDSREMNSAVSLRLQHTQKFWSSYSYGFIQIDLQNGAPGVPGTPGGVQFLRPAFYRSHNAGGYAEYRPYSWLGFYQDMRYYTVTPNNLPVEQRTALLESTTGVMFNRRWRSFVFSGRFGERLDLLKTNQENFSHTFSPEFDARVEWGKPKWVRLTGLVSYSKLNLVEQLRGYSESQRFRVEARSQRWRAWQFVLSYDHSVVAMLNVSGKNDVSDDLIGFQVEHRRFTAGYIYRYSDGFGSIFAVSPIPHPITQPLPVNELRYTPLLDRLIEGSSAYISLRLLQNLEVHGNFREERSDFFNSDQKYRSYDIRAQYRLGKFTVEASYGRYDSDILSLGGPPSGIKVNRMQFRVTRDFRIF